MLNLNQLQTAVLNAQNRFKLIKEKHPSLKAYMVFSAVNGQADIESSPSQILKQLPEAVVDNSTKSTALSIMSQIERMESRDNGESQTAKLKKQFDEIIPQLGYNDNIRVEIRFKDLSYDLIWKLQNDELVDRDLTPQTKASIKIVMGTLAKLAV